ncbi:hypothetical protein Dcar01_01720 [Deinococcus carri]|uniref:PDZ domain-containing protein n=1 Tax=Deinococcus carri TaxID=1211323 RepID=A0ABP9W792_9DEIO
MKIQLSLAVLGLTALLSACSTDTTTKTPQPTTNAEIPNVPRTVTPDRYGCPAGDSAQRPISALLGAGMQGDNYLPRLRPQTDLPDTMQDMLYSVKSLMNVYYYGFSAVDLDRVHDQAYQDTKKLFPKALASYFVPYANDARIDPLMSAYIDNFKDEHTFYRNYSQADAYRRAINNQPTATPVFGLNYAPVPGKDGAVLTDTRVGGPAFTAGLRRGDVLLSVDGTPLKRAGASDSDAQAAYSKIISAAAAKQADVTFVVRRGSEERSVTLKAALLNGAAQPWGEMRTGEGGKKHYYLRIPTFSGQGIAQRVHDLMREAQAQGATDVIIDLRNNGGGYLREYVGAVAAFSPATAGEQVRYSDGSGSSFSFDSKGVEFSASCYDPELTLPLKDTTTFTGKTAVLLNENSASASEMFSQNIRAGKNTVLIGEPTYGISNTVTGSFDLPAQRNMSVTMGRVLLNGKYADEQVKPDVAVKDDLALLADGRDVGLEAAFSQLK